MWTHRDIKIQADSEGRFIAETEDLKVNAPTLKEAREQIDKHVTSKAKARKLELKVVGILIKDTGWRYSQDDGISSGRIGKAEIIGINRTTNKIQYRGIPKDHNLVYPLPDIPESKTLLTELVKLHRDYTKSKSRLDTLTSLKQSSGRIDPEDYDERVDNLEDTYRRTKIAILAGADEIAS